MHLAADKMDLADGLPPDFKLKKALNLVTAQLYIYLKIAITRI